MPLTGERLIIEPTYPNAKELMDICNLAERENPSVGADDYADAKVRNSFWSMSNQADIVIWERDSKIDWGKVYSIHSLRHQMQTLAASDAWGIEQEHNALQLLGTMVPHRQFKQYLLTGMFMEMSQRSGVHYIFRKLRPTVAVSMRAEHGRILAALCMHPIGYYAGSWAGAMCPTDDVIAHLALMRGDEHMFWKRCNQHPAYRPEAGL